MEKYLKYTAGADTRTEDEIMQRQTKGRGCRWSDCMVEEEIKLEYLCKDMVLAGNLCVYRVTR